MVQKSRNQCTTLKQWKWIGKRTPNSGSGSNSDRGQVLMKTRKNGGGRRKKARVWKEALAVQVLKISQSPSTLPPLPRVLLPSLKNPLWKQRTTPWVRLSLLHEPPRPLHRPVPVPVPVPVPKLAYDPLARLSPAVSALTPSPGHKALWMLGNRSL